MKRIGILLLIAIMLLPVQAIALEFQVDGLTYALNADGESVTVEAADKSLNQCEIPNKVTYGDSAFTVTGIGSMAFKESTNLTKLVIPASVNSIGTDAFAKCERLKEIEMPAVAICHEIGLDVIQSLEKVIITEGTFVLPDSMFYYMDSFGSYFRMNQIKVVELPDSLEEIGNSAFYMCSGLTNIDLPEKLREIGNSAFAECTGIRNVIIPENVSSIGSRAFKNCNSLVSVIIPEKVTCISSEMFTKCSALESIVIPKEVSEIGSEAFASCTSLKSIVFPSELKKIGYRAFVACVNLENIILPDELVVIGEDAFLNCKNIKSIEVPESVTQIENGAFSGCEELIRLSAPVYTTANDLGLTNLKTIEEIVLTGNDTKLNDDAFRNMEHLKKVTLNETLETIGENAFYGCTSLSELVIPKNVKKIGTGAFFVSGLQTIIFKSEIAPKLESVSGIFPTGVQIVTPDNAVGYTKENGWPISETGDNEDGGACDLCMAPECTVIRQGDNYVFSVKQVVQNAAYQWQSSKDGVHFTNIAGETDSSMIMKATTQTNGMSVRCIVFPSSNVITLSGGAENDLYPILNGADAIWSGFGNQIVRVDAQYHKFLRVRVNGVELVNERDYLTHSGSTIVELKQEYLSSLAPGTYVMKMEFTDGKAETTFVIPTPAGTEELPDTGDHSMMMLWLTFGCATVLLMCLGVRRRIE